jgi:fibronectin type 3 domain-containing protein
MMIPPVPIILQASDGSFINKIALTWTQASGADPDHYEVYRADSGNGSKSLIGSPIDPSFDDFTAVPGSSYTYWVKVCSLAGGCSTYSSSDTGWAKVPKFIFLPVIKKP